MKWVPTARTFTRTGTSHSPTGVHVFRRMGMVTVRRWRHVSLVAGVCLAAWLGYFLLLRPGRQRAEQAPTPLPRGRFVRTVHKDEPGRLNPESWRKTPRVMCLVVTSPQYHHRRASHVKATWGHWGRGACPNTVFLTSTQDDTLQNVILSKFSSYEDLWGKVLDGLLQVNASEADWFVKVDDDTFLLYPNLLELLGPLDPAEPLYLGLSLVYRPEEGEEVTYMSGGAGYVLSRAALTRLQASHAPSRCRPPGQTAFEDVNMGYCMAALGVRAADTRDPLGRVRFLPCSPRRFLQPRPDPDLEWLLNFSKYEIHLGAESLSDLVVSFHEIRDPLDFYFLQYLVYDLKPLPPGTSRPFTSSRIPQQ